MIFILCNPFEVFQNYRLISESQILIKLLSFLVSSIIRTCSEVTVDACQTTSNFETITRVCICKDELCNGVDAQKIIDELGYTIDIDGNDESGEDDENDTEESGDDNFSTIQTTNWPSTLGTTNDVMENLNKSMIVPSINKSVSFNLSYMLALICVSTSVHRSLLNS